MIFDSHAHYDDKAFDSDRDTLLTGLFDGDICGIINVGCSIETSQTSVELSRRYPAIWAAVGVHPSEADNLDTQYLDLLASYLCDEKTVAIGEIGLDYHYETPSRGVQRAIFEDQLKLAKDLNVPVIIHDRDAHGDTLDLLRKYRPKGVVHCFSGSVEMADEIIRLGMYVGLGGSVTFKNAKNPVLVAKHVPIDMILLETDCPYLAPTPLRGKRCDSSMIKYTADRIAKERGISTAELLEATICNAKQLFEI